MTTSLTCPRDGTATQLTCIDCGSPICPACMVRTEVGLKCPDDAADALPTPPVRESGRRFPVAAVVAAVAVVAALVVAGIATFGSSGGGSDDFEPVARAGLDDEVNVGSYGVRLTRFECGERQLAARTAEGRFCVAYLTVRRTGSANEVFAGDLQLLSDGTRRYTPVLQPTPGGPPVTLVLGDAREIYALRLSGTVSFRGLLVYDVPEGTNPTELLLHDRPNNLVGRIGLAR